MCGITGFISKDVFSEDKIASIIHEMNGTQIHRGPDDDGVWVDNELGVALGHRRLSILDLSPEGHQPMVSSSRRYIIVFNGEIYNFRELHSELIGLDYRFRGHSDTEVMLAAIDYWGLETAVSKFVGMFAFALWDSYKQVLHLTRDRMGEKPLYYGWAGSSFIFSSELKAFRHHPHFTGEIDRDAMALFFRHNYITAPYSIYKNTYKLMPGSILSVSLNNRNHFVEPKAYWSLEEVMKQREHQMFAGSDMDAVTELDSLLQRTIHDQMMADVPLGAFLSGGIDSSAVVAIMQSLSEKRIKTFTIGFHDKGYNEAEHAKAVAQHIGTDHTELYVSPQEAMNVIPRLPYLYDEPFSDSSQIPTFLVSELAKRQVTVSLSGDGGDELFGGYNRYFWGSDIWGKIGKIPPRLRRFGANRILSISPNRWNALFSAAAPILPGKFKQRLPGDKMHKIAKILTVSSPEELYLRLVSHHNEPSQLVLNSTEPKTVLSDRLGNRFIQHFTEKMMYLDKLTYLPDDILAKVDRASMGVSLESRVPFLDHRIVEFASRLPMHYKVRGNTGKWVLRQVLDRYVPRELIERPKMGFGVPIDSWLRGPLKEWASQYLDPMRLKNEGYLNADYVTGIWNEHLSGKMNKQHELWNVLMFQAWLETQSKQLELS